MPDSRDNRPSIFRITVAIAGLAVVTLFIVGGIYVAVRPGPVPVTDSLCVYVHNELKGVECVQVLASDKFMKPGSIVETTTDKDGTLRVALPRADLLNDVCKVPGASFDKILFGINDPQLLSIPTLMYASNRSLAVGANIELPELNGTRIEAGPHWSQIRKITFSVDAAWFLNLDENVAADAITSCQIKESCVSRLLASQYRVVSGAVVAKGVAYSLIDNHDQKVSAEVATKTDVVNLKLGGSTDASGSTDGSIKSAIPVALGVRLVPERVLQEKRVCSDTVLFSADGRASVQISGGGGQGNIGAAQTVTAEAGQTASLSAIGSEASECDDGWERTRSEASASAKVETPSRSSLRFAYDVLSQGGHYATAATCLAGHLVGITGHDTGTQASANLVGSLRITVRSDQVQTATVVYKNLPANTSITVIDSDGKKLPETVGAGLQVNSDGQRAYRIQGPGVFVVAVTSDIVTSANGWSGRQQLPHKGTAPGEVSVSLSP